MAALFFKPALRLVLVTLRTGAVAAGVIGKDFLLAVIALIDMASKQRRAAGLDIAKSPFLNGAERVPSLLSIRRAVEADNIGHLQHENPCVRGLSGVHGEGRSVCREPAA